MTFTSFARKVLPCKACGAVIVAAGSASRMGGIDKVMADIGGQPMVLHTIRAFQETETIREIVVVTRKDLIAPIMELCNRNKMDKVKLIVEGGASRQESVTIGLRGLSKTMELAAVQDAARPFVTPRLIDHTVRTADAYGAAAPAVPVKDTIKIAKGSVVESTPDRADLFAVQTPQVFNYDMLRGALAQAEEEKFSVTDDCSAVEHMGFKVRLVPGEESNFKVTTRQDLLLARVLWEERK